MNKIVLLLNALILVVNFVLAFTTTNMQATLSQATARFGGTRTVQQNEPAVAYAKLVSSLEGVLPRPQLEKLTATQAKAVYDAMNHYEWVMQSGVNAILSRGAGDRPLVRQIQDLNQNARDEVEQQLRGTIRDDTTVRQLTTAIIRHAP
jgi:hypothetical protein